MTHDPAEYRFGRFRLDPVRRVLRADGEACRLGARALDLLLELVRERHRIVGKDELLDRVWPGLVVEENNLQVQVSALRRLLGPQAIVTVPGRGYRFVADLDDAAGAAANAAPAAAERAGPRQAPLPALPPAHLPALVGRDDDLGAGCALVAAHPLVTLTGPGGIGKTRLAQAIARHLSDGFADGVRVVELAEVGDAAGAAAALALATGVELPPGAPAGPTLAAALREQALLLLLDNCEHVVEAVVALVVPIVSRAPRVRVLATSQTPLRVAGEQLLRLRPLALPPPEEAHDPGRVASYAAVQLFVQRARAAQHGFAPADGDWAAAAAICRELDGLPLAIELAAARVPLLGLQGLRERLDGRLRLLGVGPRDAPARQHTLRATLEWSHALLDADEQRLLRRLGVFVGGFSLSLAQRTLAEPGDDPWAVLDRLAALVDKSLVAVEGGGEPRYRLLESARALALERLAACGEAEQVERRRADALRDLLDDFEVEVVLEPCFDALLLALEPEKANLHAALRWAMRTPQARATALALLASSQALWSEPDPFGDVFEHYLAARDWLDASVPTALATRFRVAFQAMARRRLRRTAEWRDEAWRVLDGYRALGDRAGTYRALCALGGAPRDVIDETRAAELLAEAQRLEEPAWSPRQRARRQLALEWFHDLGGRFEACRDAGRQHVALARATGALLVIPALSNLADTEHVIGDHAAAVALCREAIEAAAAVGRPAAAVDAYGNMVPALISLGELAQAARTIREGRALRLRTRGTAFDLLLSAALLVLRRGQRDLAARLVGCADRVYADAGHEVHPPERRMREAVLAELDAALTGADLAALLADGARWSEDEAFAHADLREG